MLTRIEERHNVKRFYKLDVQPTLFDEWSLVREWDRIGRAGSSGRNPSDARRCRHCAGLELDKEAQARLSLVVKSHLRSCDCACFRCSICTYPPSRNAKVGPSAQAADRTSQDR
ncbi:WGR domain-containing protein [Bradyrhizobium semiaridum]|uniref:WGR domain-containing protein n=1 Tax=Bradyrhizobium semiaridum TaxID=2821404 RepID=UPI001CE2BD26|nr:WGR domain-containing protein [Bradyrhizobium semiaridum]